MSKTPISKLSDVTINGLYRMGEDFVQKTKKQKEPYSGILDDRALSPYQSVLDALKGFKRKDLETVKELIWALELCSAYIKSHESEMSAELLDYTLSQIEIPNE